MPPATVTSPQQQSILRLLESANPSTPRPGEDVGALLAMMRGLTNNRSETAATDKAREIATAPPPQITTRVDTTTGQIVADVKNMQLSGDGGEDGEVQKAYDLPQVDLAKALNPLLAQFGDKPIADPNLPSEAASFGGSYKLLRERGNDPVSSLIDAGLIKLRGHGQAERLAKDVNADRIEAGLGRLKQTGQLLAEVDRQRRLNRQDAGEKRRADAEAFKERQRLFTEQNSSFQSILDKTNFLTLDQTDPLAPYQAVADQLGTTPDALPDRYRAQIDRQVRQQAQKHHNERIEAYKKNPGLGEYPTFGHVLADIGTTDPPTKDEANQLKAAWQAKREKLAEDRKNQDRADQRIAMAIDAATRAAQPKPRKLTTFDTTNASTEALASTIGDDAFDQGSARQAVADRRGRLQAKIRDLTIALAGNQETHRTMSPIVYKRNEDGSFATDASGQKIFKEGVETTSPFQHTRETDALKTDVEYKGKIAALQQELAALDTPMPEVQSARGTGTTNAPPAPINPSTRRYDAATEAKIANAMRSTGAGRAFVIKTLKKHGVIR